MGVEGKSDFLILNITADPPCGPTTSCGSCAACIKRASLAIVGQALTTERKRRKKGHEKMVMDARRALCALGVLNPSQELLNEFARRDTFHDMGRKGHMYAQEH